MLNELYKVIYESKNTNNSSYELLNKFIIPIY